MSTSESVSAQRDAGPQWLVIFLAAVAVSSLLLFCWLANRVILQPMRGHAFAVSQAKARGFDWPVEESTDYGGGDRRVLFRCPTEPGRFVDMRVKYDGKAWAVASFNEDFRPWPKELVSR